MSMSANATTAHTMAMIVRLEESSMICGLGAGSGALRLPLFSAGDAARFLWEDPDFELRLPVDVLLATNGSFMLRF